LAFEHLKEKTVSVVLWLCRGIQLTVGVGVSTDFPRTVAFRTSFDEFEIKLIVEEKAFSRNCWWKVSESRRLAGGGSL
jgi:hypothetical protein